jgi:hypothetical protein
LVKNNNVNTVLVIIFLAGAIVVIGGLIVIPVIEEAEAANPTSESRNKGQQGDIASGVQYCFTYLSGSLQSTQCKDTLQECENIRNQLIIEQGIQPTECSKERIKSN